MPALVISINQEKRGVILEATPGKVVVIGRAEECDIALPEATGLSRRHCSITYTADGFMLKDAGSTNGTFADAVKLEGEAPLKEGVIYTVGDASFQVMGLSLLPLTTKTEPPPHLPETTEEKSTQARTQAEPAPTKTTVAAPRRTKKRKTHHRALRVAKTIRNKLNPLSKDLNTNSLSIIEILLILVITFYAGLALYSYRHGGSILPPFFD